MLFKSLKISKFRQFEDETKIVFSTDNDLNVTIILGDNTFGKTTLLQAFNWCLYGEADFDKDPKNLLNIETALKMNEYEISEVDVEIELIHRGLEYTISRTQKYKKINNNISSEIPELTVSYKSADGKSNLITGIGRQGIINSILPKDLSTYFFFDTERVRNISERKDVAKSVKDILGLSIIDNARTHLGTEGNGKTVIGELYSSIDTSGDSNANEARRNMEHYSCIIDKCKEEYTTCEESIRMYENKREAVEKVLRSNESTTKIQKTIDQKRKHLEFEKTQLDVRKNEFIKLFNSEKASDYIANNLYNGVLTILDSVEGSEKYMAELNADVINELLKIGKCLCGHSLAEGSREYENVKSHLKYIPPESIGTKINVYMSDINEKINKREDFFEEIESSYKNILALKNEIANCEDEISSAEEELLGKENMDQYEQELSNCKIRLKDLNREKEKIIREETEAKRFYEQAKKVFDNLKSNTEKNKEISKYLEYASCIKEWLDTTYREKEIVVRESLEEKVNYIFSKMYHGKRRAVIDDKYKVSLLSTIGDSEIDTGESEGSNRVKSFAFISGIVSLAREKIISTADVKITTEPYPLVMDAPFSNADEQHTKNISKMLPEIAEQVIMFVMEKDWKYAKTVMDDKVGNRYLLDKKSETHTVIKEI